MFGRAHNLLMQHEIYRALPHREGGGSPAAFQAAQIGTSPLATTTAQPFANEIDFKRAGLLLYGLQIASANAAKMHLSIGAVRSVTYTEEGPLLARRTMKTTKTRMNRTSSR